MNRFLVAAAVLALGAPAMAHASSEATTSVAVRSTGLDLARSSDAALMVQRLDRAALSVCGASPFSVREYRSAVRQSTCYSQAMDQAVASLNSPTVNAVYRDRMLTVPQQVASR